MPTDMNEYAYQLGAEPSGIRELFAYGLQRKAEIGADKVFDYSLGNPSIPAPESVKQAIIDIATNVDPVALHGYTPAQGYMSTRQCIADNIQRRFGVPATAENV